MVYSITIWCNWPLIFLIYFRFASIMNSTKPKILVLFCGGTIVQQRLESGGYGDASQEQAVSTLLNLNPLLNQSFDITIETVDNIDSAAITPQHWSNLAQVIYQQYAHYDGFVLTHGTHTMAYTAGALSFALQNLGKPVVLTGAQIPACEPNSDALANYTNAVYTAAKNVAGVYLVFGENILQGVRTSKVSAAKLNAFQSTNHTKTGTIESTIKLNSDLPVRHQKAPQLRYEFCNQVEVLTLTPGTSPERIFSLIKQDLRGLIIQGYGSGAIDYSYLPVLQEAQRLKIPVVMLSQCAEGSTDMQQYDNSLQALETGVIEGFDLSLEAATTKLMWAVQNYPYPQIKTVMQQNLVGEINPIISWWNFDYQNRK